MWNKSINFVQRICWNKSSPSLFSYCSGQSRNFCAKFHVYRAFNQWISYTFTALFNTTIILRFTTRKNVMHNNEINVWTRHTILCLNARISSQYETGGPTATRNYSNARLDLAPDLVLARRINPGVVNESSARRWFPAPRKVKTIRRR